MNWEKHIESNPDILFGKPVVKGTRISVELILEKLGDGCSEEELIESYPHLNKFQIQACLQFAANYLKAESTFPVAS